MMACQDYAARVWPVCREGDIMMLDPETPLEWVVATDINEWAVVPWQPDMIHNKDASQAHFGYVTFCQIRPRVSALAWAVAHHHLSTDKLCHFARDRNVKGAEELLDCILNGHCDRDFYMDRFRSGKTAEDVPRGVLDTTNACLAELDQDNVMFFNHEEPLFRCPESGVVSQACTELPVCALEAPVEQVSECPDPPITDAGVTARSRNPRAAPAFSQLEVPVEQVSECPDQPITDAGVTARSRKPRAAPAFSNLPWMFKWLPSSPGKRFGIYRVEGKKNWSAFYVLAGPPPTFMVCAPHVLSLRAAA